tara:strand:+ start:1852 stop:2364 length:513 start_codon:yes stop_codon:yes gene_type:complete
MNQQKLKFKEEKIKSPIDGSDKCFRVFTEPETEDQYLCMKTGFMSNSKFKIGSKELNSELDKMPEIMKAVQHYDEERDIVWIPTIMNIPAKGMLFPEGNLEAWGWSYAPIVEIPKEEQVHYPIPGKENDFYTNKLDIENTKKYKKNEFDKALIDMGVLSKDFKGSLMNAK